jgi:hypothetical protein
MHSTTRTLLLHHGGAVAATVPAVLARSLLDPVAGRTGPENTLIACSGRRRHAGG